MDFADSFLYTKGTAVSELLAVRIVEKKVKGAEGEK